MAVAVKVELVAKLVISGISSSIFLILALHNLSYKITTFLLHYLVYLSHGHGQVLICHDLTYPLYFLSGLN